MTRNAPLVWRFGIASASLITAVAVYSFARFHPPQLLESFQVTNPILADQTTLFGSAPSFFYTLSLGLFIGVCATTLAKAKVHCLVWIGLVTCLELSQHPLAAGHLSTWLASILSESSWEFVGPYWTRGAFDRLDLIATLVGGFVALVLLTYLPREASDVRD